jgi:glycosyltransferase involved in cell wall biosynthesis
LMTTPLKEYFETRVRKNAKLEVIPMTVEGDRFKNCTDGSQFSFPYIGYCGYMGGNKDGVDILIKAFKIVADKFKDIRLVLMGEAEKDEMSILKKLVDDFKLNDRVIFTGKIERDKMPPLLCNANILALARPSSLQSLGGFPTKLGEYLATGHPVVVTRVGEIPAYLTDGENAFLVEPDSAELFAEKLDYVLSNPETAKKVGEKGSELVDTYFNYRYQSKRMLEFLNNI